MGDSAILVVTKGPSAGTRLEVDSELVLGREAEGLKIDDSEISRQHFSLRFSGDRLEIEDLGSLNGTFVNGVRLEAVRQLVEGDVVRIGQTTVEVESVPGGAGTVLTPREPQVTVQRDRAAEALPPAAPAPAPRSEPPAPAPGPPAPPPFGGPAPSSKRRAATRRLTPTLLAFAVIGADAAALVLYFGLR